MFRHGLPAWRYMPKDAIPRALNWKPFLLFAAFLCTGAVAQTAQPLDNGWWQIVPGERVGRITSNTSEEQILEIFGAENVRRADVGVGEGESIPGTIVYPNDPTKRLAILWKDEAQRKTPSEVRIRGRSSLWRTNTGFSLGSTLRQIEKLNGKPFILAGFAWDYSGTIVDCNQGRLKDLGCIDPQDLSKQIHGRKILLRLMPDEAAHATREYQAVLGDRYFSSGHPAMQKLNPRVYEMIVFFVP